MGNGDIANVGKLLLVIGFFSVVFGATQFGLANTGLCAGTVLGGGCTTNYAPLILPSVIGGALMVVGAWLCWVFKPQSRTPAGRYDDP